MRDALIRLLCALARTLRPLPFDRLAAALSAPGPHADEVIRWQGPGRVIVNRANPREWNLYRTGVFEPHTLAAIRAHTPRGSYAVDIGANVGLITLALSAAVGPEGRVLALEPSPTVHARLLQNLALNPFAANVIARPVAASRAAGHVTFYAPAEPISGKGSLVRHDAGWEAIEVEAQPLDALVAELGWPRVDVIKCDVEGYDMAALLGARGVLEAHRPVLLVEYEPELWAHAGHILMDLLDLLGPLDYTLYHMPPFRWRGLRRSTPVALSGPAEEIGGTRLNLLALAPRA
ncbi:MAG: FkbM family methyltransferase [Anaerolineae bacterium]